jgi:hypothetical protein
MNRLHPATTRRETTYTDGGNADIAGANICRPWWLNTRILAGDGRCWLQPIHGFKINRAAMREQQ